MIESVLFLSRPAMLALHPDPDAILISLASPHDPAPLEAGWRAVLQLEFDDICEKVLAVPAGSIPDVEDDGHLMREFFGTICRLPDARHAKAIVDFLVKHEGGCCDFVRVIAHCDHGISRSAAVAQFVAERYSVPILNAEPEWQGRVAMTDTFRANPRLLRLLLAANQSGPPAAGSCL